MSSYTDKELDKMTRDLLNGLIWVVDKYPEEKEWFYSHFQFKEDLGMHAVVWYSTMTSKVPKEYYNQISSYFAPTYDKIFHEHGYISATDFKEKPMGQIFEKLLSDVKLAAKNLTKLDEEVLQYTGLLKLGYKLRTGYDTCQAVVLAPCDIDKYIDVIKDNYMIVDIDAYRKEIINKFATYCKEKEVELKYNFPHVEIMLPHVFNDIYQKNQKLIENNERYSVVLGEIKNAMKSI